MNRKGVTLLELIVAMVLVSFVLWGASILHVSTSKTTARVSQDGKLRDELSYIMRDMEIYYRGAIAKGSVTKDPSNEGDLSSAQPGPYFYRTVIGTTATFWVGALLSPEDGATNGNEVWYGYTPATKTFVRKIYDVDEDEWTTVTLSTGKLGVYADADLNGNGIISSEETTKHSACIAAYANAAACENNGGTGAGAYPVFKVGEPEKKSVSVSALAQETGASGIRNISKTSGMTKTVFLHTAQE